MRFMMIVKSAEKWGFPPKELMDAIGKLQRGTAGQKPARCSATGDSSQLLRHPRPAFPGGSSRNRRALTEAKEVVGGYAQFELKSKEEAVEATTRFMELHKIHWPGWEGETGSSPGCYEPEDCGSKA